MSDETILDEAARITSTDRARSYGTPLANHSLTANLWGAYLEGRFFAQKSRGESPALTARDVCILNILQKISREAFAPKRDNLVDIAGYARNAEMIEAP